MATKEIKSLGNTLAYRRALEIGDASMFSLSHDGKATAIVPFIHGMRTLKSFDTSKTSSEAHKGNGDDVGNLSVVEMAKLNSNDEILLIKFATSVLPIYTSPEMADSHGLKKIFEAKNRELVNDDEIMQYIAECYAYKIVNASWTWRNRDSASEIKVSVVINKDKEILVEHAKKMPLHPILTSFQKEMGETEEPKHFYLKDIKDLAEAIKNTLQGKNDILTLDIQAELKMNTGATVYPSQLFEPVGGKIGKSPLGKKLFTVAFNIQGVKSINNSDFTKSIRYTNDKVQVGITAEKINNALRKFDLVSDGENETIISFDPNGGDISSGKAFRGTKKNLIALYKKYLNNDIEDTSFDDKLFIVANLIRGGLFQEASSKKGK